MALERRPEYQSSYGRRKCTPRTIASIQLDHDLRHHLLSRPCGTPPSYHPLSLHDIHRQRRRSTTGLCRVGEQRPRTCRSHSTPSSRDLGILSRSCASPQGQFGLEEGRDRLGTRRMGRDRDLDAVTRRLKKFNLGG